MEQFERISHDVEIMGGKACIKGTRVTVGMILLQISEGVSIDNLLEDYPYITQDDVREALRYAAWLLCSENAYLNELERANRNYEYLDKLDKSLWQLAEGRIVVKTMEELEYMTK